MKKCLFILCMSVGLCIPLSAQNWQLVWSDEFTSVISSDWVKETGGGNDLWGNNELENYQTGNATIENGNLVITAKKESVGGFDYTSARLKTEGHQSWQYGKMEAYIRVPFVIGTWPAFWMMGNNGDWPNCGEIDIMEQVNQSKIVEGTVHWYDETEASGNPDYVVTSDGGYKNFSALNGTDYHLYAVEWDADSIRWFIDGTRYYKTAINKATQTELHQSFYILLNLAIGGDMTGNVQPDDSQFPVKMYIDYVKVYQKSTVTGTVQNHDQENVSIYPNPSTGLVHIKGMNGTSLVKIYNTLGEKLLEVYTNNLIDVSTLPSGSYLMSLEANGQVRNQHFFKQ